MKDHPTVRKILEDISDIDPKFVSHDELRPYIGRFVAAKPHVESDPHFAHDLRNALLAEPIPETSTESRWMIVSPYISQWYKKSERLASGVIGATLALLIAIPLTYMMSRQSGNVIPPVFVKDVTSGLTLKQQINDKGTNAFGTLALLSTGDTSSSTQTTSTHAATLLAPSSTPATSTVTENNSYSYIYKGSTVSLNNVANVFKRKKGLDAGEELTGFLKKSNFELTNLSSFTDLNLKGMQLSEAKADGYTIAINFDDNVITISANNEISSSTDKVPSDASALEKAKAFLDAHAIDLSSYGSPRVAASDAQTKSVLYPLMLGSREVYDANGNEYGMIVVVNSSGVLSINNLTSQVYESSVYSIETNIQKIISKLPNASTSQNAASAITLDTPTQVLMRYVNTENNGTTDELFVPALIFPIKGGDMNGKKNIIIPLLKDTLGTLQSHEIDNTASVQDALQATSTPTPTP